MQSVLPAPPRPPPLWEAGAWSCSTPWRDSMWRWHTSGSKPLEILKKKNIFILTILTRKVGGGGVVSMFFILEHWKPVYLNLSIFHKGVCWIKNSSSYRQALRMIRVDILELPGATEEQTREVSHSVQCSAVQCTALHWNVFLLQTSSCMYI